MTVDVCPACGHDRAAPTMRQLWRRLFRLRLRAAACAAPADADPTGWGSDCGCQHPFHGS